MRVMLLAAVCGVLVLSSSAFAQRGGFGGGGGLDILRNEQVRKELEIVDEQYEKLQALQDEAREAMQDMFSGLRDLSDDERRERFESIREKMTEVRDDIQAKADKILLPHQKKRLEQITVQMQMRGGVANGLRGDLAEKLGITEEQQEKLREKAEEYGTELQTKIAELRKEMQDKLLEDVLTPSQLKELQDMIGDPIEIEFGRGGFGGGGFQGRGGQGAPGGGFQGRPGGNRGGAPGGNRPPSDT